MMLERRGERKQTIPIRGLEQAPEQLIYNANSPGIAY